MPLTFEIKGKIDVGCFKLAFQRLVDSNDSLRLYIAIEEDIPIQVFKEKVESPLQFLDFVDKKKPKLACREWLNGDKKIPFDLSTLLYRAVLFKLGENQFVFYLNQHHLITDGWSVKLLYDQLERYYINAIGEVTTDENEFLTFEAYANKNPFQHELENSPYWKAKLRNTLEKPQLYGVKRNQVKTDSTRVNFKLGKDRTEKLKAFSYEKDIKGLTMELALSNIFLTVICTLIYKIGNLEKFSIGMANHNRSSPKDKKTIGLFMELLPLNIAINTEDSFIDIFKKIQRESLDVLKNAMISRAPIELMKTYNVLFNFIPAIYHDFAGIPTKCNWLLADHIDSNHHIRLQVHDFNNEGDYQLQFDLNNAIFSKEQYDSIGQHFMAILDAFVANKNQKIQDVSIITPQEIKKIATWNNTTVVYESGETLLDKFEAQVLENPKNTALVFGEMSMSYLSFSKKTNQVAHFLKQQGVGQNHIVALCLDRSFEMMFFLYGILKAGAAYLPLDTATPKKRAEYILKNSQAKVFFHHNTDWNNMDTGITSSYNIRSLTDTLETFPETQPRVNVQPDDMAYVIYTSGSTGEPKGVICHHKGICNRLNWMNNDYPVTEKTVFLQKTPFTFDVSVWELFWPLQVGAKLVIAQPGEHLDQDSLLSAIATHNVNIIHFVPSMLNIFISTRDVEYRGASLKRIFCSGEALAMSTVKNTHEKLYAELYNLYGPTEASVDVTSWHCKKGDYLNGVPIGHPVANTKIYILDHDLNPVPIGVVGELYIAGVQVAHGYLNKDQLTRKRFLEDSFSNNSDSKLYKTGDLARYRMDGAIEYMGRTDTQIKLRGLRIELGEIEKSLESYPGVNQAVVKVIHQNEQEYLASYYSGNTIEERDLRIALEKYLPKYMVPSYYVHLDTFEFLSSGKINRKKLPNITLQALEDKRTYMGPSNEFEEIIVEVWKEVLKVAQISIDDDFIQIGGNSLNAMVITSRLKESFELNVLTLADIFKYPTAKTYGKYVESILIRLMEEG